MELHWVVLLKEILLFFNEISHIVSYSLIQIWWKYVTAEYLDIATKYTRHLSHN